MINVNIVNPYDSSVEIPQSFYYFRNRLENLINQNFDSITGEVNIKLSRAENNIVFSTEVESTINMNDKIYLTLFIEKHISSFNYYSIENPEDKLIYELEKLAYKNEYLKIWVEFRLDYKGVKFYNIILQSDKKIRIELPENLSLNNGKSHKELLNIIVTTLKDIFLTADSMLHQGKLTVRIEDRLKDFEHEETTLIHKFDTRGLKNNTNFSTFTYSEEPLTSVIVKYSNRRLIVVEQNK